MSVEDTLFKVDVALALIWYIHALYVAMVKQQKYFDSYNRINFTLLCIILWAISSALTEHWGALAFALLWAIFMQLAAYGYLIKEKRVDTKEEA